MLEAIALIFVLLTSVTLGMGAARGILGVFLYIMKVTAVPPPSGQLVSRATAYPARGFSIRHDSMTSHDGAARLAREAA